MLGHGHRTRLVGVFAHPDDESFAAGGLLAALAERGAEVTVISATRGEPAIPALLAAVPEARVIIAGGIPGNPSARAILAQCNPRPYSDLYGDASMIMHWALHCASCRKAENRAAAGRIGTALVVDAPAQIMPRRPDQSCRLQPFFEGGRVTR